MKTNSKIWHGSHEPESFLTPEPALKSLEDFNAEKHAIQLAAAAACTNGIACPKCGEELLDSWPMITLSSIPPQKDIHCPECDYSGYRIA